MDTMTPEENDELQRLQAIAVYSSGAPLSLTDNKHWDAFFNKLRPAYKRASTKQLSTTLLDKVYSEVSTNVENKIESAKTVGVQSDGWSNIRKEGVMNFIVTTPQPVVHSTVHTEHNRLIISRTKFQKW